MAARKPGPRRGAGTTRALILDEAERLIGLHGMEGFRLQDLAEQVGIRPPSVFAHFPGRKAITEAVSRRVVEGIFSALTVVEPQDPPQTVETMVSGLVRHLAANPVRIRLLMRDLVQSGAGVEEDQSQPLVDQVASQLDELLQRGAQQGHFREVSVHGFMAQTVGAVLANFAWFRVTEWDQPVPEHEIDTVEREALDLVRRYLSPRLP